jgi:hypothetical protein
VLLLGALLALAGCGTKEDASLFVYAKGMTLVKGTNAFGSKLDGGVEIVFDLGKWSQGSVTVEAISLGLYRDTAQVVPGATFTLPADRTFPFELAPNQVHTIKYAIAKTSLTADETAQLCAGPVKLNGTVKQAGKAELLQLTTEPMNVNGCP